MQGFARLMMPMAGLCVVALGCLAGFSVVNGLMYPDYEKNYYSVLELKETVAAQKVQQEPSRLDLRVELARQRWEQKKFTDAAEAFRDVWVNNHSTPNQYDEKFVRNALDLASVYTDEAGFAEAQKVYEDILKYDSQFMAGDDPRIGRDYSNLGLSFFMLGERERTWEGRRSWLQKSFDHYAKAEKIFRGKPSFQTQLVACLQNESIAYSENADSDKAVALREEAEKIVQGWQSSGHGSPISSQRQPI